MISYQLTSGFLGISIAGMIIYLIRRDHLHTHHAGWWLLLAFLIALLGIFPKIVDTLANHLDISYPPTLLFAGGMGILLVKVLSIDIQQSQQERKVRRMAQRLALLEDELQQLKRKG